MGFIVLICILKSELKSTEVLNMGGINVCKGILNKFSLLKCDFIIELQSYYSIF